MDILILQVGAETLYRTHLTPRLKRIGIYTTFLH